MQLGFRSIGYCQWCTRVIFVESESRDLQVRVIWNFVESWLGRVESESGHKNRRVTSSHWFTSSSECRVIENFKLFLCIFGPPVDLQWL